MRYERFNNRLTKTGLLYENIFYSNITTEKSMGLLEELDSKTINKLIQEDERSGLKLNGKAIRLPEFQNR